MVGTSFLDYIMIARNTFRLKQGRGGKWIRLTQAYSHCEASQENRREASTVRMLPFFDSLATPQLRGSTRYCGACNNPGKSTKGIGGRREASLLAA